MINLPLKPEHWPEFRVLTRASFGSAAAGGESGGGWQIRAMQSDGPSASGLILLNYGRCLLPQIGTARLLYRFGKFLGRIVGAASGSPAQGQQWDPAVDSMDIPDLTGMEVRIQAGRYQPDPEAEPVAWETVFWGTCEYQSDDGWGGSDIPSGERTYHLVDALHRLKRWNLDRHGFYSASVTIFDAKGHPGYNVAPGAPAQLAGNRVADVANVFATQSNVAAICHVRPGAGANWTDEQAINHALAVSRPSGEPLFVLSGAVDQFADASSVEVPDGTTAWDFLVGITGRGRGRGAVRLEWTESDASGPLTPLLVSYAQLSADLSYTSPTSGAAVTINGAADNGTTVEVDAIGDHRFVSGSLILGDAEQYQVGYLESLGERIQSMATISYEDATLVTGWAASSKTAFNLITVPTKRTDQKWKPVYQLHRLSRGFDFTVKNGSGSGASRCDYQCNDTGAIVAGTVPGTSILTARIMDDLPIYEGYIYDTVPAREDGSTVTTFSGTPARRDPLIWARDSAGNFIPAGAMTEQVSLKILPDGFLIEASNNQETGLRYFCDTDGAATGQRVYNYTQIGMTVAFELPHRVRIATGDPNARRRLTVRHSGINLWVAHQGAVWDYDSTNKTSGASPAKRACAASTTGFPGILRDDRNELARLHFLAVAWYGPMDALYPGSAPARRSSQWSLRCCGDIPSSESYDGGGVVYPDVGEVVTYLNANGQRIALNTPVSSFVYDNEAGVTTWTTDWQDLDFVR